MKSFVLCHSHLILLYFTFYYYTCNTYNSYNRYDIYNAKLTYDSYIPNNNRYSRKLAKRFMTKKALWLVRLNKEDISKIHFAELMNIYNYEGQVKLRH